jgi:hypothetical protein
MNCALICIIAGSLIATPAAAQIAPSNPALGDTIAGIAAAAGRNTTPAEETSSLLAAQRAFDDADRLSDAGDDIMERVVRHCGTRAIESAGEVRATIGSLRQVIAIGRASAQVTGRVR